MQFKQGMKVITSDEQTVGHIDRLVLDPKTKVVTHLVVRKGWLFTEDKVVPTDLIATAAGDRAVLRDSAGDLSGVTRFEETHFIPVWELPARDTADPQQPKLYGYPPLGTWWNYPGYTNLPYVTEKVRNIPEGTVALKAGAKVVSADDEHVGDIEQVFAEPGSDRATHLLVAKGLIRKERKLIPTFWIDRVNAKQVTLSVESTLIDMLPEYDEDDEKRNYLVFFPAVEEQHETAVVGAVAYGVTARSSQAASELARANFIPRHPGYRVSSPVITSEFEKTPRPWSHVVTIPATSPDPDHPDRALITIGTYFVDAPNAEAAYEEARKQLDEHSPGWTPLEHGEVVVPAEQVARLLASTKQIHQFAGVN
jgi:uncharacterized protein YrrD